MPHLNYISHIFFKVCKKKVEKPNIKTNEPKRYYKSTILQKYLARITLKLKTTNAIFVMVTGKYT